MVAALVGFALAVMPAASPPAFADAAEDQAAAQVASERCAKMRAENQIPDRYKENCEAKVAADLKSGKAKDESTWLSGVCKWVPDLPIVGNPCEVLMGLLKGAYDQYSGLVSSLRTGAGLITDPSGTMNKAILDFAMTLSSNLQSLLTKVLAEMSHLSSPDLTSAGFLRTYAAGAGIAMFVLVFMIARVFYRASQGDVTGEELAESLFVWLPKAMVLVFFGPALGYLLVELSNGATTSITAYFAPDVGSLTTKIVAMVALSSIGLLPGGPLFAIVVLALGFLGTISLVLGLLMQLLTQYLTGAVMAISFVMLVDPSTRPKALKLPMTWVALTFARPLLFFLLGGIASISDSAFSVSAVQDDGLRSLVTALVAALALLIVGVAPWSLLKFAPLLPGGGAARVGRSARSSSSGAIGGVAGSAMTALAYRRLQGSPGGGSGGGSSSSGSDSAGGDRQGTAPQPRREPQTAGGQSASGDQAGATSPQTPSTASTPAAGTPAGGTSPALAGSKAAGAGAGGPAAGAGGAGGVAGGAGGAAGGAAAAGAGAATGGLATAALIGVQLADGAKRTAQDVAHRASDQVPEE
ncbi:MAG: hypothetical protein JXA67_12135 [Micromonosporaceae bacterium]|nr:hypothetical protein [Micromonosporaceae bacterium]